MNIPFDGKINPSDLRYYLNLREEKEFRVDHVKLQEYFPLSVVIEGTFKIYQVYLHFFLKLEFIFILINSKNLETKKLFLENFYFLTKNKSENFFFLR